MQKTQNNTLKIVISFAISGILLLASAKSASAACNFYSSMTASTKNVLNWATACSISASTVEGVDNGATDASTTNTAQLSLTTGGNITINNTGTLAVGSLTVGAGSIAVQAGGAIKSGTPIYLQDTDADGWADNFTLTNFRTATASGYRRLGLFDSYSTVDCGPSSFSLTNTCYSYSQSTYYAYAQSAYYGYSQSSYYGYGQGIYYSYSQGTYYGYGQSSYAAYSYSQLYYSSCFLPGTQVALADGSTKSIEDIKTGDIILSYDLANRRTFPQVVSKLLVHKDVQGGYLNINGTIKVTGNHLMWSPSRNAWITAESLSIGDTLLNSDGNAYTVSSIEHVDGTNTVYNISLPGPYHAYFADGVLVHNEKI